MPLAVSLSQPKARTCLSLSETITFLAIVGALVDPASVVISTALDDVPPDLSQYYIAPSLTFITRSSPKLSCDQ